MDVLYVLGNGSRWGDNELKYSLRSIARYASGVGDVFLAGTHKPPFVGGKVKFLQVEQTLDRARNVQQTIQAAIDWFGLGDFLLSSDDHFYVKKTDFNAYPYYVKGALPNALSSGVFGDLRYTRTLVNTYSLLKAAGFPTVNYSQHANTHISAKIWRECAPIWQTALTLDDGVEPTCIVLNALAAEGGFKGVKRADCKIKKTDGELDLLAQIGERECFSIYDSAISNGVGEFLKNHFPEKCEYEL